MIESYEVLENKLIVKARSSKKEERCPRCNERSERVHGHYQRHPYDLPLANWVIQFCLTVKRFYCFNSSCKQKTFGESFEPWLARYAHRSRRLTEKQSCVAKVLSAKASEALLAQLQMAISHDSALKLLRQQALRPIATAKVLGLDDFAIRKGHSYGTILVDLEKHEVIDLLASREAQVVSRWLKQHPDIKIISRDRSQEYKKACDDAAPEAIQVADRWHLLKNLGDSLLPWLERQKHYLVEEGVALEAKTRAEQVLIDRENKGKQRLRLFTKAKQLQAQGLSQRKIAHKLNLTKSTLSRWLKHGLPGKTRTSLLDSYLPYLKEQWQAGHSNKQQLYRDIVAQGFQGSQGSVKRYLAALKAGFAEPKQAAKATKKRLRCYSPSEARHLFVGDELALSEADQKRLTRLFKTLAEAKPIYDIVQRFTKLFKSEDPDDQVIQAFHVWLDDAKHCAIPELTRFAKGLAYDQAAIEAALILPWSNGQTEGKITKLKLIKRTMYGRANFDLLRQKVLLAT